MIQKYFHCGSIKIEELQFLEKYLSCLLYSVSSEINNLTMNIAMCLDESSTFLSEENYILLENSCKEMEGVMKN